MEALIATYGDDSSSSSDQDVSPPTSHSFHHNSKSEDLKSEPVRLQPPPLSLLNSPNPVDYMEVGQGSRVRSFPRIQGNYALHVFIPANYLDCVGERRAEESPLEWSKHQTTIPTVKFEVVIQF